MTHAKQERYDAAILVLGTMDRIFATLEVNDCWICTSWINSTTGYARIRVLIDKPRQLAVHRLVYTHLVGHVPGELDLDHLCRVRSCCNPDHLQVKTRQKNLHASSLAPAGRNAAKVACKYGHAYSEENTRYVTDRQGYVHRQCRACK